MATKETSCYGNVSDRIHNTELPMLQSAVESITDQQSASTDEDRSWRLFGRQVQMSRCAGPCVSSSLLETAFAQ